MKVTLSEIENNANVRAKKTDGPAGLLVYQQVIEAILVRYHR